MPRYLKIDLIATSLAVVILLVVSAASLVVVPELVTPVMANATLVNAPIMPPTIPLLALRKPRSLALSLVGTASWYGSVLEGHNTASGETFHKGELTAAHRTLPFGTLVRVTDLGTGRSVVVRINDRGVLFSERVIDLSSAAAQDLGILRAGVARVRLEVLKKALVQVPKEETAEPATVETARTGDLPGI